MRRFIVVLTLIIIGAIGSIVWYIQGKSAVNPSDKTQKVFVISQGENIRDIAASLKREGFIKSPLVFFFLIKQQGLDDKIQAGDFRLSPSMDALQIAQSLTHGSLDVWVTFPEGKRATEIAEILAKKLPTYQATWTQQLIAKEGYLFPDTYLIPTDADITLLLRLFANNFAAKYAEAAVGSTSQLTQDQVVILASIVEREAITEDDMKGVASVLENRMNIGMPLGSDVTVEYALGYQPVEKTWWKKDLTADDLQINSPYNTRTHAGLPPGPISNPGLTALKSVLHPAKTNYLYFIADTNGKVHFAQTIEQHNANIRKYLP